MTALELLREKKFKGVPLTAIEQVILDAYYRAFDPDHMTLVQQAANELEHMNERIKEHLR